MVIILTSPFQGAENFSLCRFSRGPYPLFTHVAGFCICCVLKSQKLREQGEKERNQPHLPQCCRCEASLGKGITNGIVTPVFNPISTLEKFDRCTNLEFVEQPRA